MTLIRAVTACFFVHIFLAIAEVSFWAWKIKVLCVPFRHPQPPCPARLVEYLVKRPPKGAFMLL